MQKLKSILPLVFAAALADRTQTGLRRVLSIRGAIRQKGLLLFRYARCVRGLFFHGPVEVFYLFLAIVDVRNAAT